MLIIITTVSPVDVVSADVLLAGLLTMMKYIATDGSQTLKEISIP